MTAQKPDTELEKLLLAARLAGEQPYDALGSLISTVGKFEGQRVYWYALEDGYVPNPRPLDHLCYELKCTQNMRLGATIIRAMELYGAD